MSDDIQYDSNKRKFDDQGAAPPPPTRRATGFSAPIAPSPPETVAAAATPPATYNSVPPLIDEIQIAKQRAQAIAAKLFSSASANRSNGENGEDSGFSADHSLKPMGPLTMSHVGLGMTPPSSIPAYGYQGPSKKIEIPNGRVGVIIGKGGETIKYLQSQSGAKIQVTRDMDVDPYSQTRMVELVGNSEQINKAEQLINEVLSEADAGGSGVLSARRVGNMPTGGDKFVMKVANNKVGLIIGKGGETIKTMQAKSGARIQIIPLHLPPGDTSQERTVQIDGTPEQIESAKQLVNEVTSGENRPRNPQMSGGYSQQGYHQPRPSTWGPPGPPQMQQPSYGYMQPGAYPAQPQYNMPQPPSGGYQSSYPDQSSNQQTQQPAAGTGYDYYNQQQAPQQQPAGGSQQPATGTGYDYYNQQQAPQQQPAGGSNQQTQQPATGTGYDYYNQQQAAQQQPAGGSAAPADGNSYNYSQPHPNYISQGSYGDPAYSQPATGQQQGYGQESYAGSYYAQPGYAQPASTPQAGYDHQQGYGSTAAYPPQDGSAPTYGAPGATAQVPPQETPPPVVSATQQGYNGQPPSSAAASYPTQSGYGSQAPAGGYTQSPSLVPPAYGHPPQVQKPPTQLPPTSQAGYIQPGYGQPPPAQSG